MFTVEQVYDLYIRCHRELVSRGRGMGYTTPAVSKGYDFRTDPDIPVPAGFEKSEERAREFAEYCIGKHRESGEFGLCPAETEEYVRRNAEKCLAEYGNPVYPGADTLKLHCATGYKADLIFAFAVKYFIDYGATLEFYFDRDKWESRGDYCSLGKMTFTISGKYPEGHISTRRFRAYGM